jgi:hypothetical protein
MLSFSDEQLSMIWLTTRPLQPSARAAFLESLGHRFRGGSSVANFELAAALGELQHEFMPAVKTNTGARNRYGGQFNRR